MASESENDQTTHGYAWSDGTIQPIPEPPKSYALPSGVVMDPKPVPHVTQATLDKAYADWLKEYTRWKADYAAWEAKYGHK